MHMLYIERYPVEFSGHLLLYGEIFLTVRPHYLCVMHMHMRERGVTQHMFLLLLSSGNGEGSLAVHQQSQ